ncbi:MAG: sugar nucleotide-binding protein [Gammaproteobacteria bacterium]|nr:sugar nucleotide-binding protein [Gammaproteobacteria bacterium]
MRILLTGGSGLLGTEILKLDANIEAPTRNDLDITDDEAVADYIRSSQPDIVLHAAAITNNRDIETDPAEAVDVNIHGTTSIARACIGTRIRLVYLSTDYVYRGDRGNYLETDEVLPTNLYAWTKLGGEAAVRSVPNHLIIRTSFGGNSFPYPVAFSDKWSSKEYVDVIAPEILEAACSPLTGVLNIGGPRRTIYEYASSRNRDVRKIKREDSVFESPADTSLDLSRWKAYQDGKTIARPVRNCRVCDSDRLVKYLDLGMMPLANSLAPSAAAALQMNRFPMQVQYCEQCSLSQLTVVIDPREMFSHYTYRSSVSQGYVDHCRAMARSAGKSLKLSSGDLVVDIAGNDGTLLAEFADELGVSVLNVDPAENISKIAEERGIPTINDFWSGAVAERIVEDHGRPKLITATNVFAHVDDVRGFVSAARDCLADDGALMLEFPYGVDFIEHREFDTIYFEHLSYVLIKPVVLLARMSDLDVFDIEKHDIHGGTVRVFLGKPGSHPVGSAVQEFLEREEAAGFHDAKRYLEWNHEIDELINQLSKELRSLREDGRKVAAFAASAKGNTLLNACRLDRRTLSYIVDDTPEKIGRFSPGTGIPIVDRSVLASDPPDYLVILAWNFAQEIIDNTPGFEGKYIIPIPAFKIV